MTQTNTNTNKTFHQPASQTRQNTRTQQHGEYIRQLLSLRKECLLKLVIFSPGAVCWRMWGGFISSTEPAYFAFFSQYVVRDLVV